MLQDLKTIKKLDPKFYKGTLLCSLVVGFLCIAFFFAFFQKTTINKELKNILTALTQIENQKNKKNVPSEERLKYLSKQLNTLKEAYEDLPKNILYTRAVKKIESQDNPQLAFKEFLFETKQRLKNQALQHSLPFPEKYGFEGYEGRLPSLKELPDLYLKVAIMEELMKILLNQSQLHIAELSFAETIEANFSAQDPEMYREHHINIKSFGNYPAFASFLDKLPSLNHIYELHALHISPSSREGAGEGELEAKFELSVFKIKPLANTDLHR